MNVLAIDQGTSATKAIVFDETAHVLASAEEPVNPVSVPGGGVEQDPNQLWESVLRAGRRAVTEAGVPIGAIGLANQGETVLAWDRSSGQPLSVAISWQDRRSASICEELSDRAAELQQRSGLPLDPYFAAPKMAWLRRAVTGEGVVTTSDTWLVHRLTGAFVTDGSTASRTLLLDLDAGTWSQASCAAFGLDVADLPEVIPGARFIGETEAFGASMSVTGLSVDQQAALIGEGCLDEGEAKCTYGTGAFLLVNAGSRPRRSAAGLSASLAWQLEESSTFCLDGQLYTAGAALGWLQRWGFLSGAEELDVVAGSVADPGGVTVVPAFVGLGAPWWDPLATATIEGISLGTDPAQVVRATLDGIAASVALLARAAGTDIGRGLASLKVDGGLTRSELLMQTQADLLQVPVEVAAAADATSAGVAALARLGAAEGGSLRDLIPSSLPSRCFEPAISADEAAVRLERFEGAVRRVMDRPGHL